MNGASNSGRTDAPAPLVIFTAVVLIAAGVGASVWTLWQSLRSAPVAPPAADAPAAPLLASPLQQSSASGAPASTSAPLRGGEFNTDFEQMRQREATGQAAAAVLRRARKAGAGSPWTEDQVQAVERGDLAIR